jgi:hypothetical protein
VPKLQPESVEEGRRMNAARDLGTQEAAGCFLATYTFCELFNIEIVLSD